jgi:hypothetical protein
MQGDLNISYLVVSFPMLYERCCLLFSYLPTHKRHMKYWTRRQKGLLYVKRTVSSKGRDTPSHASNGTLAHFKLQTSRVRGKHKKTFSQIRLM